jgi:16S rRNA (uracil1498-N3)-methyltransferase
VTVAFAPVKGERAEWFAQKLTEIGVDRIAPVLSERGVVRWNEERARKQSARMETVAREACLQSRRLHLPTILPASPLDTFLGEHPEAVLADPEGTPIDAKHRTIVVGPEGGFSEAERSGRAEVALPGNVLRATTAAIVAGAIVCGLRDDQLGASPR